MSEHNDEFEEAENASIESDFSFNLEVNEDDEDLFSGTADNEKKSKPQRRSKKSVKPPIVHCHLCDKPFDDLESYTKHMKNHLFIDMYKTTSGEKTIMDHCVTSARNILRTIGEVKISGAFADEVKKVLLFLCDLQDDELKVFVDSISSVLYTCLPSPVTMTPTLFNSTFTRNVNAVLNDAGNRDDFVFALKSILISPANDCTLNWLIGKFALQLAYSVEIFILKCITSPWDLLCKDTSVERDSPDELDFQQSVHYIGGSCVWSLIRVGKNSEKWSRILKCVYEKFLVSDLAGKPSDEIESWFNGQDRGGLMYIQENVWTFLMALSALLVKVEENDGSVKHDIVFQKVCDDYVLLFLWSEIVEDRLSDEESDHLLKKFCYFYVNAWGRGVSMRLNNAIPKRSRDKVATCSRLSTT